MTIKNVGTEMRFVGLKRSGNHAILNWIIRQSRGSLVHFNNVRPDEPYRERDLRTRTAEDVRSVDRAIYSIEDTSLAVITDPHSYPQRQIYPDLHPERRIDILLIRDPLNLLASRFRRGESWGQMNSYVGGVSVSQLWVTYAREFVGDTHWLQYPCVRVNYNVWCKSAEYRRSLADELELEFTDEGFKDVTGFGGGSSFESTSMDGKGHLMKTDQRWMQFSNDPAFVRLFDDPLLLDLTEQLFELEDTTKAFINKKLRPRATRASALSRWWATTVTQRIVARLRRSTLLKSLHRSLISKRRERKLPIRRSK